MKGVYFGNYYSGDYNLILSKKEIESPSPKIETVDLPGTDGLLDMTDYFGDVKYKNRKLKFEFSTALRGNELLELYSTIQNDITGRHFDSIILDDSQDFKYTGRVTSVKLSEGKISKLIVECDCEPYRTSVDDTVVMFPLNGLAFAENYGDPNGDGKTDSLDANYLMKIANDIQLGVITDLSPYIGSCDLNFDGAIDNSDVAFMDSFFSQSKYSDIRQYAESRGIMRDTEIEIDFGRKVADVELTVMFSQYGTSPYWEMYVDGALYIKSATGQRTVALSGNHRLMLRTPRSGSVTIRYPKSKL